MQELQVTLSNVGKSIYTGSVYL